jgi:hypothetical protein
MGLWMLCRQYVFAKLVSERTHVDIESHWFGPDVHNVTTDFDNGFNAERDHRSQQLYADLTQASLRNGATVFENLVRIKQETVLYTDQVRTLQRRASHATMESIDRNVRVAGYGLTAATWVRDISASVLVVGATFLSGGAALGVLGAGSALKGTATYQDTGNVGAAVLQGTGTFVVGMISIAPNLATATAASRGVTATMQASSASSLVAPAAASTAEKVTLMVVGAQLNASFTMATGLAQGNSVRQSVTAAAISGGLSMLPAGDLLGKIALPVSMRLVTDTVVSMASDAASTAGGNAMADRQAITQPPQVSGRGRELSEVPAELQATQPPAEHVRQMAMRPL